MQNPKYDDDGEEEYLEEEEEVVTTTTTTKKGKKGKKIIHTNIATTITKIKTQEDEEGNDYNYSNDKTKKPQTKKNKDNNSNLSNNDNNFNTNKKVLNKENNNNPIKQNNLNINKINHNNQINENTNNIIKNQPNLNDNKTFNQINKTNINNNNNKTNSLNKLDNIMISGTNQINYKDNPIKHKSSYIPIAQPKQEYTLSDNPEIEQKIKDLFLNKIHSSDFNKMKCFKKWKLNIIKPKIFLGKKDRKIRLRTRIYRDEPAKSSSIVSRRKAKDEIIVSNPIKRNPNIKHNEYQNYIIKNSPNVGQKEKKIKTLNELYNESLKEDEKKEAIKNRKIDSVKKMKDIFNKRDIIYIIIM